MTPKKLVSVILLAAFLVHNVSLAIVLQEDAIVIAIVDFRNTGQDSEMDYLEKTIPETIITRMAKGGRVEIVERGRLQEALKEMELGMAGVVDEQTAVELGRAVGANAILLGSFVSIGETIRLNARLIDVETSRIIKAETVQGAVGEEIFQLMDQLAQSMENQLVGDSEVTVQFQPIPITEAAEEKLPERKPFYKKWWFWTLAGAAVAGGVYAATVAGEKEAKTATVNVTVFIEP